MTHRVILLLPLCHAKCSEDLNRESSHSTFFFNWKFSSFSRQPRFNLKLLEVLKNEKSNMTTGQNGLTFFFFFTFLFHFVSTYHVTKITTTTKKLQCVPCICHNILNKIFPKILFAVSYKYYFGFVCVHFCVCCFVTCTTI